ncbi:hypothetical protein Daura_40155 [Dactylosporangium aurantiacum]|uniref:Uncharacterized protein n=1 Tax=Dactylosporangium aurantiacum TaxID=35754 RepID=A0A9Q9MKE7_9ACTN|nr:hypothetical protein [Dactylosporangium aurantiacum]MDG6101360.1 hypothetical protein [Dactylosporangium aurantiacum]UWZ52782.1 hypothetical protein Daura_40155 [Dactylosporangium aurantiacum]
MPAAAADNHPDNAEATRTAAAEDAGPDTEAPPRNPLEAIRRAQANRSLPPGVQQHGGGKSSAGKGAKAKSPRMYNRHK